MLRLLEFGTIVIWCLIRFDVENILEEVRRWEK